MFPKYQDVEIPLLIEIYKRGGEIRPSEKNDNNENIYDSVSKHFNLTYEERNQLTNHKNQYKWNNMVQWARNSLLKKGKLSSPKHGIWQITDAGINIIKK